jgi:hypothetical protein
MLHCVNVENGERLQRLRARGLRFQQGRNMWLSTDRPDRAACRA